MEFNHRHSASLLPGAGLRGRTDVHDPTPSIGVSVITAATRWGAMPSSRVVVVLAGLASDPDRSFRSRPPRARQSYGQGTNRLRQTSVKISPPRHRAVPRWLQQPLAFHAPFRFSPFPVPSRLRNRGGFGNRRIDCPDRILPDILLEQPRRDPQRSRFRPTDHAKGRVVWRPNPTSRPPRPPTFRLPVAHPADADGLPAASRLGLVQLAVHSGPRRYLERECPALGDRPDRARHRPASPPASGRQFQHSPLHLHPTRTVFFRAHRQERANSFLSDAVRAPEPFELQRKVLAHDVLPGKRIPVLRGKPFPRRKVGLRAEGARPLIHAVQPIPEVLRVGRAQAVVDREVEYIQLIQVEEAVRNRIRQLVAKQV